MGVLICYMINKGIQIRMDPIAIDPLAGPRTVGRLGRSVGSKSSVKSVGQVARLMEASNLIYVYDPDFVTKVKQFSEQ